MDDSRSALPLFPPLPAARSGMLAVDDLHTLYWEECGNPDGIPVIFLHGGPGGGLSPRHRQFFHPDAYRIILFEQRGAGRSTPLGEVRNNTTPLLIADIEALRCMLGINRWLVFGGSWGATLALAYGQAHPQACLGFILRGVFLFTQAEVDWFMHGIGQFFPEAYADFVAPIPLQQRAQLLQAYAQRLFSEDAAVSLQAARDWSRFESRCSFLLPQSDTNAEADSDVVARGIGRLEAHYFVHHGFMQEDQLMRNLDRIAHLPAIIVQGRYDVVCPPAAAYRLHGAWPRSVLHIVPDAGHAALEPGTTAALVAATEQFRLQRRFD
ncbi:MAG TPA: prolyl aminopeptidase [Oxalicibacterium sp.]|nr:prolyl aminopeptidase [Oxalicibacterium sp.]